MFTLVPHTTHEMQPLDKAVFGPLKVNWQKACHDFLQSNPGKVVTKYNFSSLLNKAWMNTMLPQTIINGFRSCGVFPFDPRAVLDHDLPQNVVDNGSEEGTNQPPVNPPRFTFEEEALFRTRYEEKCDIYSDPRYVAWLKMNHPEVDVDEDPCIDSDEFDDSLTEKGLSEFMNQNDLFSDLPLSRLDSVTDFFSDVPPIETVGASKGRQL